MLEHRVKSGGYGIQLQINIINIIEKLSRGSERWFVRAVMLGRGGSNSFFSFKHGRHDIKRQRGNSIRVADGDWEIQYEK